MDNQSHKKFTGCENQIILENIKKIGSLDKEAVIRIPLVKGVNNSEENIVRTAKFVYDNLKSRLIEILPYHNLGNPKYDILGLTDLKHEYPLLDKDEIEKAKKLIEQCGVRTIEYK